MGYFSQSNIRENIFFWHSLTYATWISRKLFKIKHSLFDVWLIHVKCSIVVNKYKKRVTSDWVYKMHNLKKNEQFSSKPYKLRLLICIPFNKSWRKKTNRSVQETKRTVQEAYRTVQERKRTVQEAYRTVPCKWCSSTV